MARQRDGVFTWIHADHLSSATRITDVNGLEIRRLAYAAFGEEAENQGTGDDPKYTYTGKEQDNTGLYYFGARYYDPALSRFITADTVYDAGPQGLNRYSYALNNPIIYRDPTGHQILGAYGNPFVRLVDGAQKTSKTICDWTGARARDVADWIEDHGEEIGKGLEQVGQAMELTGATRTGVGGGLVVGSAVVSLSSGGTLVIGTAPAAIVGTKMAAEGVVLMGAGEVVRQTGKNLQERAKEKKSSSKDLKREFTLGEHIQDPITRKNLHKVKFEKGKKMLENLGLKAVEQPGGRISFVDKYGVERVAWDPASKKGSSHWHKFYRDKYGQYYELNDKGYIKAYGKSNAVPQVHIRSGG